MSLLIDSCVDNPSLPEIANSLRLDGTNDFLTRTSGSAGNRQTWVWSGWVKRSKLGVQQMLFNAGASTSQVTQVLWRSTDILRFYTFTGGTAVSVDTSAVFRDVSAHYHVTVGFDSTQATNTNRVRIFIQDVAQGISFSGTITQNTNEFVNAASTQHHIGCWNNGSGPLNYHDGYFSNVCFIDGYPTGVTQGNWASTDLAALFAYTDSNGQWRSLSKAALTSLASVGGTNSFFLPFDNGSSTTTLGYDASSKGNNWTLNNMVRDGSVNDCWTIDTPTNNFATLNPVDSFISGTLGTLTTGAMTISAGGARASTIWVNDTSGKIYWEINIPTAASNFPMPMISEQVATTSWLSTGHLCWYSTDGSLVYSGSYTGANGYILTSGDTAMLAMDCATGKVWLGKNGAWLVSGNPAAGTGAAHTFASPSTPRRLGGYSNDYVMNFNFGQLPVAGGSFYADAGGYFRYTPPTGFKALCVKNIDDSQGLTTSGTFTGNAVADGPMVFTNGVPSSLTIDGNAVTWGTHADKLSNGFKLRTASAPYNDSASNAFSVTVSGNKFKYANAQTN